MAHPQSPGKEESKDSQEYLHLQKRLQELEADAATRSEIDIPGTNPLQRFLYWLSPNWLRTLLKKLNRNAEIDYLRRSYEFDALWYLKNNTDVAKIEVDPTYHYVTYGEAESRDPSPGFHLTQSRVHAFKKRNFRTCYYVAYLKLRHKSLRKEISNAYEQLETTAKGICPSDWHKGAFSPKVSVIVPNYNHAAFLAQRLDSIYNQTYKNIEVILLDDSSTDASVSVLNQYAQRYPEITRVIVNEKNSGSPFAQWKKGLSAATGKLIWIAESDDYCELNFLETLVEFFRDEALQLAYCKTNFVEEQGKLSSKATAMTYQHYVSELSRNKWTRPYVETAHNEVKIALGLKNTIPNASGVLFKKPQELPLLDNPAWQQMKICGDWVFYLNIIRGGKIGFSPQTTNYYRFHSNNSSSAKKHKQPFYYKEHEVVAKEIARLYSVPASLLERKFQSLKAYWKKNFQDSATPDWAFEDYYSLKDIKAQQKQHLPNIMVVCHDFGGGGGEMFPIRLANELHELGHTVTFFDHNGLTPNLAFRNSLSPGIPVIQRNEHLTDIPGLIKDFGIDILHTHHLSTDSFFAEELGKMTRAPKHIVTLHGMYELCLEAFTHRQKLLTSHIDHWVYISDKNLTPFKEIRGFSLSSFTKIPVGAKFRPIEKVERSTFNIPAEAFVVCIASRAIAEKGWEESIQAVELARAKTSLDIHLLLAGDGPVKAELSRKSLPPYIHLLGFQKNIVGLYQMSNLGLLASRYIGESCPLTLVECLSAQTPMVATALGEVPVMLTLKPGNSAGTAIPLDNKEIPTEKIAKAIAFYATDQTAYQAAKANCLPCAQRYNMEPIAKKYSETYQNILGSTHVRN